MLWFRSCFLTFPSSCVYYRKGCSFLQTSKVRIDLVLRAENFQEFSFGKTIM
jgi:hypothetical protein